MKRDPTLLQTFGLRIGGAAMALAVLLGGGGCTTLNPYANASFNEPLESRAPALLEAPRHSFAVDGARGNPRVLMFLSLSGGGSRAAYLSAATMLALQDMKSSLGIDMLAEVDVMSSVSGGSMAAAYYAASRDTAITDAALLGRIAPLLSATPPAQPKLKLEAQGRLVCSGALTAEEAAALRGLLGGAQADADWQQLLQLCLSATYPAWERDAALQAMKTDYLALWLGNWFWPANVWRYWTSSFDRSDIMAQTLANNIYRRRGLLGDELKLSDLNPTRPYLLINATNASGEMIDEEEPDEFPFGSVFTFTREDFSDRLASDADRYSLARAVMGSSSFPLVFASMSLRDYRSPARPRCPPPDSPDAYDCHTERYLHIFDGGNSDNLGLRSVKRALFELEVRGQLQPYDRILVLMVDAFTTPRGAPRDKPDPRSLLSLLIDTNVSDAVDSLLQTNRDGLLAEFIDAQLGWSRECAAADGGLRQLPKALCSQLRALDSSRKQTLATDRQGQPLLGLNLKDRLVFYHFGFADVERFAPSPEVGKALKRALDNIPTSFRIGHGDVDLIDLAVRMVISPDNPCMRAMAGLTRQTEVASAQQIAQARLDCRRSEGGLRLPSQP